MAIHACRKRRLPVSRSMRQWLRSLSLTVIVSVLVAPVRRPVRHSSGERADGRE